MSEHLKRRTFAIISHPDAGKTTLTEKLLLFGGAIQMAGTIKGRKASRHATADWMQLDAPRHLHVPTRRSIARLAHRFGLRVTRIDDDSGPFQVWGSEVYRRGGTLAGAGRGGSPACASPS